MTDNTQLKNIEEDEGVQLLQMLFGQQEKISEHCRTAMEVLAVLLPDSEACRVLGYLVYEHVFRSPADERELLDKMIDFLYEVRPRDKELLSKENAYSVISPSLFIAGRFAVAYGTEEQARLVSTAIIECAFRMANGLVNSDEPSDLDDEIDRHGFETAWSKRDELRAELEQKYVDIALFGMIQ